MGKSEKLKKDLNKKIPKRILFISSLIMQDKFKEALDEIKKNETNKPKNKIIDIDKSGLLIEIGYGLRDHKIVQRGIDIGEQILKNKKNPKYKAHIYYNLANGYSYLHELSGKTINTKDDLIIENLRKTKFYLKKALANCSDYNLKKQILVNYGICLESLGRTAEAVYAYDEALHIDKDFSMAIANKAIALRFFADISGKYRAAIYREAYHSIKSVINKPDLIAIGGLGAKKRFEDEIKKIEDAFKDKSSLEKNIEHQNYEAKLLSDFEKYYLEFCVNEKLFLNFHIHEDKCEASINDPIFIRIITKKPIKRFYHLAKYINQIKEDYAIARLLLVQSKYKREDYDRISKRTIFVNTLDYSQFNLYNGLLKSSFKEAYGILDKIAFFINDYCNLKIDEKKISFRSMWTSNNSKKIKTKLLKLKNSSLYALYDIFQDFESGQYQKITKIRNALIHRKLVIFDSLLTNWDRKDEEYNIGYNTMLTETIKLLQLTKSSIIYLINFVNIEEKKKIKGKNVIPMYADTKQFL